MSPAPLTVAVIGATSGGADLAALYAQAGLQVLFFDDSGRAEQLGAKGVLQQALARAPFIDPGAAVRIRVLPLTDDFSEFAKVISFCDMSDWALARRQAFYPQLFAHLPPRAIATVGRTTYTAQELAGQLAPSERARFFLTRLFVPARRSRLMECTSYGSDPDFLSTLSHFYLTRLGKDTLLVPDSAGGLALRLGLFSLATALRSALDLGLSVEETDFYGGALAGRSPRSVFGALDWYGPAACVQDLSQLQAALGDDPFRAAFDPAPLAALLLASDRPKAQFTFYEPPYGFLAGRDTETTTLYLDEPGRDRRALRMPRHDWHFDLLREEDVGQRLARLLKAPDPYGRFVWTIWRETMRYAAHLSLALDMPVGVIDRAMRWGFGYEIGPFELWDRLGVRAVAEHMEQDGLPIPEAAQRVLALPKATFYTSTRGRRSHFSARANRHDELPVSPADIPLGILREENGELLREGPYSLLDLGEGTGCLSVRLPSGFVLGPEFTAFLARLLDEWPRFGLGGLLLHSEGRDFSLGLDYARLLAQCALGEFAKLESECRERQALLLRLKRAPFPVVAALSGKVLDGGLELALQATRIEAHIECGFGFGEWSLGVVPSCGGMKELLYRMSEHVRERGPFAATRAAYDILSGAQVFPNAFAARQAGLLRRGDRLSLARAHLLYEARLTLRDLIDNGFTPSAVPSLKLSGPGGAAYLLAQETLAWRAGRRSRYDLIQARQTADVLNGGAVGPHEGVTESALLDLERQAFMTLCRHPQTQTRLREALSRGF